MNSTRLKARDIPVNGVSKVLFSICRSCGSLFSNRNGVSGEYCCKTCRRVAKALEKSGIEVNPRNCSNFLKSRKCAVCKKPLDSGVSVNTRYCSEKCKRAVRRSSKQYSRRIKVENATAAIERDDWRCYLCGRFIDPTEPADRPMSLNIDHLIPVSPARGFPRGTGVLVNIAVTHRNCNYKKKNKFVQEALEKLGKNIDYHGRSNITPRYIDIYQKYLMGEIPCISFDLL